MFLTSVDRSRVFSYHAKGRGSLVERPIRECTDMITVISEYFLNGCGRCERFATSDCSTRRWSDGLAELRQICLGMKLNEAVKWGHPCYMHAHRNVAIIGALRAEFRLNFFHAALMKDPGGVLEKQGPNTPHPSMIRFIDNAQVLILRPVIESYLAEAMGYAELGIVPSKHNADVQLPDELTEVLESDLELADAFYRLTPGRQKSYAINLNSAKKRETRLSRIAKFRDHILAGKGALER